MNSFLYFSFPFSSSGITIRINALIGGIRCYASDTNPRPSSMDYIWTLVITGYDDTFLDPSRLGRTPGSTVYVALQGVNAVNTFTLNTTIGDTSIQGIRARDNLICVYPYTYKAARRVNQSGHQVGFPQLLQSCLLEKPSNLHVYIHFHFMQM